MIEVLVQRGKTFSHMLPSYLKFSHPIQSNGPTKKFISKTTSAHNFVDVCDITEIYIYAKYFLKSINPWQNYNPDKTYM